jgi:hypothetical protein
MNADEADGGAVDDVVVVLEDEVGDVELAPISVESCDVVGVDDAAIAADFSISSNSRLKIESKQPIR